MDAPLSGQERPRITQGAIFSKVMTSVTRLPDFGLSTLGLILVGQGGQAFQASSTRSSQLGSWSQLDQRRASSIFRASSSGLLGQPDKPLSSQLDHARAACQLEFCRCSSAAGWRDRVEPAPPPGYGKENSLVEGFSTGSARNDTLRYTQTQTATAQDLSGAARIGRMSAVLMPHDDPM